MAPESEPSRKRLESWKEIAAYLNRDVRTAKRWETDERLPVHRHQHKSLASVYAYEDELKAWLNQRQQPPEPAKPAAVRPRRRRAAVPAVVVGMVVLAAALVYWVTRAPALPFQQRDWALIAQFENRTGEAVLDGTVEYALERELANSQFVNVVPRERIADALRLMQKPSETAINREIAREICLRDGEIGVLIAGKVEKLEKTYVLSAVLINPASGVTAASFSEEADGQGQIVGAISRLSRRVRKGLGEELTASPKQGQTLALLPAEKPEKVSTPSLRALLLYSRADALVARHRSDRASELLRQALIEDPLFASAHILLAHALSNQGKHDQARPHYEQALALSNRSTERERLFILASYHQRISDDSRKAAQTLELLLDLYPDHYWAAGNLMMTYNAQGLPERAVPYTVRRADLRPNNFDHQLHAAQALALTAAISRADHYLKRAEKLLGAEAADPFRRWRFARVKLYPAHVKWARGELQGAAGEAARIAREIGSAAEEDRDPLRWETASMYLVLGRQRAAHEILKSISITPDDLALFALAMDDLATAEKQLHIAPESHRSAILLARIGSLTDAERAFVHPDAERRAYAPYSPGVWDSLARGEIAFARGRTAEAIPLLTHAVTRLRTWPTSYFFLGVDALSRAWEQQGDRAKSIEVLEEAARLGRPSVFWGPAPLFWMKNELRRAEMYRRAGREQEAREVSQSVANLLALADPGFHVASASLGTSGSTTRSR